MTTTYLNTGRS